MIPNSPLIALKVTGVNHETAPVGIREQFALAGDRLAEVLRSVQSRTGECVVISTCNRFEIYQWSSQQDTAVSLPLTNLLDTEFADVAAHIYTHRGPEAVRHLFRVAAGVDSLILGEVQILGQVQRAWQASHKVGAAGPVLSQLFHKAVSLGKRVHSETPISRRPASVSYAAVVLAKQILGPDLQARRVLVIGTGEVGEGVARCLHEHGLHAVVVAHRQFERAKDVARRYDADISTWESLPQELSAADVVISSTSAPHIILQRQHIADAMRDREDRPMYLIDLAVPRDIDPASAEQPGVYLHNIDDLQAVVSTTLRERESALPAIRHLIETEASRFVEWLLSRSTAPTIRELGAQAERVARNELQWAMSKLPDLTPRERQVIETLAARITGKMLHGPIQWLKAQALESAEPDYTDYIMDEIDVRQVPELFYLERDSIT